MSCRHTSRSTPLMALRYVTISLLTTILVLAWAPQGIAQEEGEELEVLLQLPAYGEPIFGEVTVGADIYPPETEIDRVEIYLDGRLMALIEESPWEQLIDVGQENVEHQFQVVVYAVDGNSAASNVFTPRIETDEEISVDLQQLFVTIERGGERVLDLERDDFVVLDNGQSQGLVTFERGDVPFTAMLLVDASFSMRGRRLAVALEGAQAFVEGMHELDQAKLMLFADRVVHETPFTTFGSVISVGLAGVEARGGTALNDHLFLAMKRLEGRQGRRVIVILSDGIDVESVLSMEQARWKARQLQPVIYWIRLEEGEEGDDSSHRSRWRSMDEHAEEVAELRETVFESGGRIETIRSIEEVDDAFRWILEDLRQQYVLGYYPSETDSRNPWHDVLVRVRDSSLEVRTRSGYLEPRGWKDGR